jgi:hypothetical protein
MADEFKLRLQAAHARRMKDTEEKQAIAAAAQRAASMLSAAELQALDALEPAARTRLDAAASVDPQRYTVQVDTKSTRRHVLMLREATGAGRAMEFTVDVDREARTVAVNLSNLQSSKNLVPPTKADKFAIATLEGLLEDFVGGGLR